MNASGLPRNTAKNTVATAIPNNTYNTCIAHSDDRTRVHHEDVFSGTRQKGAMRMTVPLPHIEPNANNIMEKNRIGTNTEIHDENTPRGLYTTPHSMYNTSDTIGAHAKHVGPVTRAARRSSAPGTYRNKTPVITANANIPHIEHTLPASGTSEGHFTLSLARYCTHSKPLPFAAYCQTSSSKESIA